MATRILFCTGVFPPLLGGPATVVSRLAHELTAQGYLCTVLTSGPRQRSALPFSVSRVSLRIPQPLRGLLILLKTLRAARAADVIYAFDTYTSGYAAALAAQFFKKPLVLRFTGDAAWEQAYTLKETSDDILAYQSRAPRTKALARRQFILSQADRVVTDCEFLTTVLAAMRVPQEKIRVINNAIDPHEQAAPDSDKIVCMARLVSWKGIEAVINALPAVRASVPDATLVIAGTGPEEAHLRDVAQKTASKHITFTGAIHGVEKENMLRSAGVFILNTFYEGMSNALLEAMSYGLPIIATPAGANTELIQNEHSGIIISYNDQEAIEQSLIDLLKNKDRARQYGASAHEASKRYSWERLVQKNKKVIAELV